MGVVMLMRVVVMPVVIMRVVIMPVVVVRMVIMRVVMPVVVVHVVIMRVVIMPVVVVRVVIMRVFMPMVVMGVILMPMILAKFAQAQALCRDQSYDLAFGFHPGKGAGQPWGQFFTNPENQISLCQIAGLRGAQLEGMRISPLSSNKSAVPVSPITIETKEWVTGKSVTTRSVSAASGVDIMAQANARE
jgi:hypothetical protein